MLKIIRKAKNSLWVKVTFVVLAGSFFIGFLVLPSANRVGGGGDEIAAVVGGRNVYRREVAGAIVQMRERYREQLGDAYEGLKKYFEERVPQQAYDQLVDRRVAEAQADRLGFVTSPEELRRSITASPGLQIGGKFSPKLYREYLERRRMTEAEFEGDLARQMALQKVASLIAAQVKISNAELEQRYRDENTKVDLDVYLLDPSALAAGEIPVTDAEAGEYYQSHTVDFLKPEQREIIYFVFDGTAAPFAGMEEATKVSDEQVRQYYDSNAVKFTLHEKNWRVADILFSTRPTGPDDKRAEDTRKREARKRADAALQRLKAGESFESVANKESDDMANKRLQNGGVLAGGYLTEGYFKKKVAAEFMKLSPGERSGVFEAEDGFHIVQTLKVFEKGERKPLDEVADVVRTSLRQENGARLAQKAAEKALQEISGRSLRDYALEDPTTRFLEVAHVGRDDVIPKVGQDPGLSKKIFDELKPGGRAVLLELNRRWIVLQVDKKLESAPAPLEEVKGRIVEILREQKGVARARNVAEEARAQLERGAKPAELSRKFKGLSVKNTGLFARTGRESAEGSSGPGVVPGVGDSADLKAAAFALTGKAPVTAQVFEVAPKAGSAGKESSAPKIAFARLKSRQEADPSGFEAARAGLSAKLRNEREEALYEEWVKAAREEVQVQILIPAAAFAAGDESAS